MNRERIFFNSFTMQLPTLPVAYKLSTRNSHLIGAMARIRGRAMVRAMARVKVSIRVYGLSEG